MENIKVKLYQTFSSRLLGNSIIILCSLFIGTWSLLNHYLFKTAALDLGLFNKALYDYAHFKHSDITLLFSGNTVDFLGDHFSLIIIILSPLYYLFGSYTLLLVQVVFIAIGAIYLRKYIQLKGGHPFLTNLALIHFFSIWGIYAAISTDFHTNVLAAMLVPALLYEFEKNNLKRFALICFVMIICRENIGFWLFFVLLGMHIHNKFKLLKSKPVFHILIILFPFFYSVIVTSYIIPGINHTTVQSHYLRFQSLGQSTSEVMQYIFLHPIEVLKQLFENTSGDATHDMIKMQLHISVFFSGGILFLFRPVYLLMLLPIYLQKMLGYDISLWGVDYHYSIEFAPILSVLVFEVINLLKKVQYQVIFYTVIIISTISISTKNIATKYAVFKQSLRTLFTNEYNSMKYAKETYELMGKLPLDAVVSAHSNITPHLCDEKKVYHFPVVMDAEYIITFKQYYSTYPLNEEQYKDTLSYYTHHFAVVGETSNAVLLRKK